MDIDSKSGFLLGEWRVYPLRNMLAGPDGKQHIEPKVMQVLELLARNPGNVLKREDILSELWGGRAMSDEPLTRCIAALRGALDDSPKDPIFIQTIPKAGYRLICPVLPLPNDDDHAISNASLSEKSGSILSRRSWILALSLGLVIATSLSTLYRVGQSENEIGDKLIVEAATLSRLSRNSIAVLPFRDLSGGTKNESFVVGIHTDIVSRLANMSSMEKVISRTSVERYKNTSVPAATIGQELGVATLLEGDVQRIGDRVRINVNLIDAETEGYLWAETYERELTAENLFAIQSEISSQVAETMQITLSIEDSEEIEAMPTNSLAAYREFVLGHEAIAMRTASSIEKGRGHFENAIAFDPDYALAYVGLADSIYLLAEYAGVPSEDTRELRRSAIDKALALQPMSGEAYTSLAVLKAAEDEDDDARKYFEKAIDLSPNYATAYFWYGIFFKVNGNFEDALKMIRRATELDPLAPVLAREEATVLWNLRRSEEAKKVALRGVQQNPEFTSLYTLMSRMLQVNGRLGEAMQWQDAAVGLDPFGSRTKIRQCYLYLELGDDAAAERCYDVLDEEQLGSLSVERANLYWYRQQYDEAIDYLESTSSGQDSRYLKFFLALAYTNAEKPGRARTIWEELYPQLYGNSRPIVEQSRIFWTSFIAYSQFAVGETERANDLFDQILEHLGSMNRVEYDSYRYSDVFIHAVRGEQQKAIEALRTAIDSGWRQSWWDLRLPQFDAMRKIPEWNELVARLEEDIVQQRLWYERHRGDPLF